MSADPSSSTPAPVPFGAEIKRKPRTLVLCFDGTGNEYDDTNTNVVKLYSALRKDKVEDQLCYYQAGVGTYLAPGIVSPFFRWAARLLDQAVAWYLSEHVTAGYKFLMQNYNVGDKVCIFGFSRGAYTARALAGMLSKVGLLSKDNMEQVHFAYKLYKSTGTRNEALASGFKAAFCRDVPIDFVGVWDTVASMGFIVDRFIPLVNTKIRVFRHALSLDEHRSKFRPRLYYRPLTDNSETEAPHETDVKEVWFVGCHSDVGGGAVLDEEKHALANISLRWMVEQVVRARCQISFDDGALERLGILLTIKQEGFLAVPTNKDGTGEHSDDHHVHDAVQKINDELKRAPSWWVLEVLPTAFTRRNKDGECVTSWWPHFGRGRQLPPNPLFHTSVRIRKNHPKLNYKPRAYYEEGTETYVR